MEKSTVRFAEAGEPFFLLNLTVQNYWTIFSVGAEKKPWEAIMEARTFRGPAFRGVECYIFHLAGGIVAIFVSRINALDAGPVDAATERISVAERRFNIRFIERHGLDVVDNDEPFRFLKEDGTGAVGLTAIYEPLNPNQILQPVAECSRAIREASIATL